MENILWRDILMHYKLWMTKTYQYKQYEQKYSF